MKLRKPDPFTCKRCGFSGNYSPCFFREVDYKTRTGVCKKCAPKQGEKTMTVKSVLAKEEPVIKKRTPKVVLPKG